MEQNLIKDFAKQIVDEIGLAYALEQDEKIFQLRNSLSIAHEETQNAMREIERLARDNDRLSKERDEARQAISMLMHGVASGGWKR